MLLSTSRHVCYSCIRPPSTSVTIKILQHACLLELHIISRYQFLCPASTSVVVGLNQQVYMLHLPQTRIYVPILVPNQRACKHNFTILTGIYMYVTAVHDQQPCLFKLITISIHVCYSFILSASMYVTFAPGPGIENLILPMLSYPRHQVTSPCYIAS